MHCMGVDNLLGRPVDPSLIGMLGGIEGKDTGVDLATKAIIADKQDKVFNINYLSYIITLKKSFIFFNIFKKIIFWENKNFFY